MSETVQTLFLCLNSPLRKSRGNLDSIPPSEVVQSSKSSKTKKPPRKTPTHSSESLDEFSACADSRNIPHLFKELAQGLLSWILVDLFFPWEVHRGQGQDSLRSFETRDLGYIGKPIVFPHSSQWREGLGPQDPLSPKEGTHST